METLPLMFQTPCNNYATIKEKSMLNNAILKTRWFAVIQQAYPDAANHFFKSAVEFFSGVFQLETPKTLHTYLPTDSFNDP